MFKSLKEKLSGWFKKEEPKKAEPKRAEKKEVTKKVVEKKIAAKKTEKRPVEKKSVVKEAKAKEKKVDVDTKLRKRAGAIEEEVPSKFNAATQGFEPDLEKIEEELKYVEGTADVSGLKEEVVEDIAESEVEDEIVEKVSEEAATEKKTGFFGRIKKAFVSEAAVEQVEERAEELRSELEAETVEAAVDEPEVLAAAEVETEITEDTGFFGKLARKLTHSALEERDFDDAFEEFEFTLLEHNVALSVVDKIKEELKKSLVGKQFGRKDVAAGILSALKGAIDSVLIEPEDLIEKIRAKKDGPYVILFFGINGSGKTTSIAKLAWKLKSEGFSVVMAAGDTFRAASIEQLETHGSRIGVEVVKSDYGKDPASVAFDAIAHARKIRAQVVLIDTAGRMYTRTNLMREMEKIVKVANADLKIFVGESITGNDATEQARMFAETAGIDGIILSKADIDEKAGTILSVSHVTGKPILYLGVGQEYADLKEFTKKEVFENLGLE